MDDKILKTIEQCRKLRAFVRDNYDKNNSDLMPEDTDDSAEAFDHGYMCGLSNAAEIIGNILEMDFK